jgi:hypothetical protein
MWDSNPRPLLHKSNAQPTELIEQLPPLFASRYHEAKSNINITTLTLDIGIEPTTSSLTAMRSAN